MEYTFTVAIHADTRMRAMAILIAILNTLRTAGIDCQVRD